MPEVPDLTDPRYEDEIAYFVAYEKYYFGDGYAEERLHHSVTLMNEVLADCERDLEWVKTRVVASIGCGCSGDLLSWPAAAKIGVDPLLYAYQKLDMLGQDAAGTNPTLLLSVGAEDIPLIDDCVDLIICRNVLDHMPDPQAGAKEMARILKPEGLLWLGVDIGGPPTPDEPSVFHSEDEVKALLSQSFSITTFKQVDRPYSQNRDHSVRVIGTKRESSSAKLDRDAVLDRYEKKWSADA